MALSIYAYHASMKEIAANSRYVISMGDPCGIGPEIIVKLCASMGVHEQPLIVGSHARLAQAAALCDAALPAHITDIGVDVSALPWGEVHAAAGEAAYRYIEAGIALCKSHQAQALITAPINKAALHAAGHHYPGHTEILAQHAGDIGVAMMLANPELRVVLTTIHCSLKDAIARVTQASVLKAITHAHEAMRRMGVQRPRIAVAGLNPHAGENGLFGDEERLHIAPAITQARAQGMDATGPWPGDTVFMQARGEVMAGQSRGRFDVVVAQYHDQGLIPVKYLGVDEGVNITLGLPFVRTSPDHGTAFDIAGRGVASEKSLRTALHYAAQLSSKIAS
jgi:4-phospho-D-threonate 3-dehydrogenase / 4-phospho-D-erythronate 3-dehydrogenase